VLKAKVRRRRAGVNGGTRQEFAAGQCQLISFEELMREILE
jgi:hypothetical protein